MTLGNTFDGFYSLLSGNTKYSINESQYYFKGVTKLIA